MTSIPIMRERILETIRSHDSTPYPTGDAIADANTIGYRTARDQIATAVEELFEALEQARRSRISQGTKTGLARLKASGAGLGNRVNLPEAQAKGAASNRARAADRDAEILGALGGLDLDALTKEQVAQALNARGLFSARGKPWTAVTIRRPLGRINRVRS